MSIRFILAIALPLVACDSSTRQQTPSADSNTQPMHDSSTQPMHDSSTQPAIDAPPQTMADASSTNPAACGLTCNPMNNVGCSGGMTCSAWSQNGTYTAGCFAAAGTAPVFPDGEFHVCHPGSTATADRCPLGTYCDDGLEICMTVCDPASGGTPLYPNSPSTSWAVLDNPSCAGAYGDDCKIKDYLNNYVDLCLPYCTNVQ